jgi:uncharacterized protein
MASFVIPVHDLMHRPGNMREFSLDLELKNDLGTGAVSIPVGSSIQLDLRLESVHEGILATGVIDATAKADCSRCLDPMEIALEVDFQELFAYSGVSEEDFTIDAEQIDLEPVVRDEVVLSLPFQPVCKPDCAGLCSECGVKWAENRGHAHETQVDARWSELMNLKKED